MNSRRFSLAISFALVLSLGFAYGLSPLEKSSSAAPAQDNAPFKGKLVLVNLESKHSLLLEHAQVRQLGERSFLVGKGCDQAQSSDWTKGQKIWVPMTRVELLVEFESVEAMQKAWQEYQKNAPPSPPEQAGQAGSP